MLMLSRICDHLGHLGLRDLVSKDPAHSFALGMDLQHNPGCLGTVHCKESLQDVHDEFHGGIVVVDENYLVKRGALELWRRFLDDQARPFPPAFNVAHVPTVYRAQIRRLQAPASKSPLAMPMSPIGVTQL